MKEQSFGQLTEIVWEWVCSPETNPPVSDEYFCPTRDIFQERLGSFLRILLDSANAERAFMLSAIVGEIGNNSFDHNIGNWPDVSGIFFGHVLDMGKNGVVLADRGQGILKTLARVRPDLQRDVDALRVAFTEKVSGRAPEDRGNGLKFVREGVKSNALHLEFFSGNSSVISNATIAFLERDTSVRGCLALLSF